MSVASEVEDFLARYVDAGGQEEFLLSLADQVDMGRQLTQRQLDAALKWKANMEGRTNTAKALWRDVIRAAHPDLATDEGDRRWRERFTKLANLAQEREDVPALTWLKELLTGDIR